MTTHSLTRCLKRTQFKTYGINFFRGDNSFNSQARVYGLPGLSHAILEASAFDKEISESDPGLSYELGFEGNLSRGLSVGAEYIFYFKENNFEYNAFNISIRQIF